MRLFVASFFAKETQDRLLQTAERIESNYPPHSMRVTSRANLHLTFLFMGEIPATRISEICRTLDQSLDQLRTISVKPDQIGVFPNPLRPRILWIGLEPKGQLMNLAKLIRNGLREFASDEKKFLPHITLARFNSEHAAFGPNFQKQDSSLLEAAFTDTIDAVHLVKSELKPCGPVYSVLESFRLKDNLC